MAIRRILLPLTGEAPDAHVATYALRLAERLGAHVTAGYGYEPVNYATAVSHGPVYDVMQELDVERRAKARTHFDRAVAATKLQIASAPMYGRSSAAWFDHDSTASLLSSGALADLVVLGAPGEAATPVTWNMVDDALFRLRRPVLAVPAHASQSNFSEATVAWNGSAEAAAAVERSVDLLSPGAHVNIVQVGDLPAKGDDGKHVADYLGCHGFRCDMRFLPDQPKRTAELLKNEARATHSNCIVMGGFTRSRVRQTVLGGVTSYMLRYSDLPLIMAH